MNHRGLFSTSLHSTDVDVIAARNALAPLFDKYKVDLVINGHDHEYERSAPITDGDPPTVQPGGGRARRTSSARAPAPTPYAVGTTDCSVPRHEDRASGQGTPYIGALFAAPDRRPRRSR